MEIPKKIKDEIWDYCRLNNITNIDEFTVRLIQQGFTIEKYGATPMTVEKVVEKIVEKIVEVPVEKIVEKIVEVPVEMFDNDLIIKHKEQLILIQSLTEEKDSLINVNKELEKELEIEKKKNKKNIYGE